MVTDIDRSNCIGCPHLGIVRTLNHPEGEMSCLFSLIPCDNCRHYINKFVIEKRKEQEQKKHRDWYLD